MTYLYMPNDGDVYQSSVGPTSFEAGQIIECDLKVFRFTGNGYEELIPIDEYDLDSWNIVEVKG